MNVIVSDSRGKELARFKGGTAAGINTVVWSMRVDAAARPAGRGSFSLDQWHPLGMYTITLEAGGQKLTQPAQIVRTQRWAVGTSFPSIIRNQP